MAEWCINASVNIFASDKCLSPVWCQAIISTNGDIFFIGSLEPMSVKFNSKYNNFLLKMHIKMTSAKSNFVSVSMWEGAFTLHMRPRSEHPIPSLDAIKTSELMFHVCSDPSLCLRFLSQTSVSELATSCRDYLWRGRPSLSKVVQYACSNLPIQVVATAG